MRITIRNDQCEDSLILVRTWHHLLILITITIRKTKITGRSVHKEAGSFLTLPVMHTVPALLHFDFTYLKHGLYVGIVWYIPHNFLCVRAKGSLKCLHRIEM